MSDTLETRTAAVCLRRAAHAPGHTREPTLRVPAARGAALDLIVEEHLLGDATYSTEDVMNAVRMEVARVSRLHTRLTDYVLRSDASQDGAP